MSATDLDFGAGAEARVVRLINRGAVAVTWQVASVSAAWLAVDPVAGSLPPGEIALEVAVARGALAPGDHHATIDLRVGDRAIRLHVRVEQPPPPPAAVAALDPLALAFAPDDDVLPVTLANAGGVALDWRLEGPAWLVVAPAEGTLSAGGSVRIDVTPDRSGLPDGTARTTLRLVSNGGAPVVDVSVEIVSPPRLAVTPGELDFGDAGTSLSLDLANTGGGDLGWTATADDAWLALSVASGSVAPGSTHRVTVRATRDGLPAGTHRSRVRVASNGGGVDVPVTLTVPAAPPPPPPPSPPGGQVALAGTVVDQFSGAGLAGLTVQFDGGTAVTDGSGRFSISGTPSSSLRPLSISGTAVWTRGTFARASHDRWLVIPRGFDMAGYDDMAREYEPRTVRWVDPPRLYVDATPPAGYPTGSELDTWVAEVQAAAADFVQAWSRGEIAVSGVTVGTNPPAQGTAGWIVVGFSEDPSIYSGANTVGLARTFWTQTRTIYFARVWLRFSLLSGPGNAPWRRAVVGHELGHTMGLGHMERGTTSIMTPSISSTDLTSFDHAVGDVLYSRSPGNTSPDQDSASTFRGGLSPAMLAPAGEHGWVCGAPGAR